MTPEHERWAEALAVERRHGSSARTFAAERLTTLATAGDLAGCARWRHIQARLEMLGDTGRRQ